MAKGWHGVAQKGDAKWRTMSTGVSELREPVLAPVLQPSSDG